MTERSDEDVELRHRTTTDEARREGDADGGQELPAPDQIGGSGVADLGQEEPQLIDGLDARTKVAKSD